MQVKAFAEKAVQNSFAKQSAKLAEAEGFVVAAKEEQEAAAADKKGGLQRQLNELDGAIKNEAHKLSQIQTAVRTGWRFSYYLRGCLGFCS